MRVRRTVKKRDVIKIGYLDMIGSLLNQQWIPGSETCRRYYLTLIVWQEISL